MTSPISGIHSIGFPATSGSIGPSGSGADFGKLLQNTISTLQSTQQDASASIQNFLTGKNEDIHSTVLATQKAQMAFDLGLQVRNKIVSAYQEIMKMQM